MNDIEEASEISDPLGGNESKMKIRRLITTQKINFRKRKPTTTPLVFPVRSAGEHRSDPNIPESVKPLGRSLPRGRSGDENPPEYNKSPPDSPKEFNPDEPYDTPIDSPQNEPTTNSDPSSEPQTPPSERTTKSGPSSEPHTPPSEVNPSSPSSPVEEKEPIANQESPLNRTPSVTNEQQNSQPATQNSEANDNYVWCLPCSFKPNGSLFLLLLQIFLTVICIICAVYAMYIVGMPHICGFSPIRGCCGNDPPRWVI